MQAKDVMTIDVETVTPDTEVGEIARRLIARNISAVPVVDSNGKVVGIVSEGDLMRRSENETERRPSWWMRVLADPEERARDYVKTHGKCAQDIMSRNVISVSEDTPLAEIAETLEKHHIKRVTVMRDGKLVGIVSRANLLQGLVAVKPQVQVSHSDRELKADITRALTEANLNHDHVSVVVAEGAATLWGAVESDAARKAIGLAAEAVPGVVRIENNINVMPAVVRANFGTM